MKKEKEQLNEMSKTAANLTEEEQEKLYYLVQGMAIASENRDKSA